VNQDGLSWPQIGWFGPGKQNRMGFFRASGEANCRHRNRPKEFAGQLCARDCENLRALLDRRRLIKLPIHRKDSAVGNEQDHEDCGGTMDPLKSLMYAISSLAAAIEGVDQ
jgi:hypothetical protein